MRDPINYYGQGGKLIGSLRWGVSRCTCGAAGDRIIRECRCLPPDHMFTFANQHAFRPGDRLVFSSGRRQLWHVRLWHWIKRGFRKDRGFVVTGVVDSTTVTVR